MTELQIKKVEPVARNLTEQEESALIWHENLAVDARHGHEEWKPEDADRYKADARATILRGGEAVLAKLVGDFDAHEREEAAKPRKSWVHDVEAEKEGPDPDAVKGLGF